VEKNDLKLVLDRTDAIIDAAKNDNLSLADQAGLYAAMRLLVADIEQYIAERDLAAYANEKARNVRWHVGAILGFAVTNGHDAGQHRSWALGELSSLRTELKSEG
jgi:hypothetical protein